MIINGENYKIDDTYNNVVTIPDCFVVSKNKLGDGHGEAKLYFGSKKAVHGFFGVGQTCFDCFVLKKDLIKYLITLKNEYFNPSQEYNGKRDFRKLWSKRMDEVSHCEDIIRFKVKVQDQIVGSRGYVNSVDGGYKLLRELSLPLVSYVSPMRLSDSSGNVLFYWKLFVDFDAIAQHKKGPLVFNYGKNLKHNQNIPSIDVSTINNYRRVRDGQDKYRELLLEECPFCPITMVNDERLLIASHIKPWAVCSKKEKTDPKNGFMLTPLYDKLFDRGFITFSSDRKMLVSSWLSPKNCSRLKLENNTFYQRLPIDEERENYLKYHREYVFKG